MKYKVTKAFGSFKVGNIVSDSDLYIRRKIQEGGCLVPVTEEKMEPKKIKNKMELDDSKNKRGD